MVDFGQANYGSRGVAFGVALPHNCQVSSGAAHVLAASKFHVLDAYKLLFVLYGMDHGSGLAVET